MANIRRTAMGDKVDIDMLRLANENTIAVGNAKLNARGDELGPGGKIVKTRAQIMQEYHKLHSPVAEDTPIATSAASLSKATLGEEPAPVKQMTKPTAKDTPIPQSNRPRGSFADAVAKETQPTIPEDEDE